MRIARYTVGIFKHQIRLGKPLLNITFPHFGADAPHSFSPVEKTREHAHTLLTQDAERRILWKRFERIKNR
jgi:hypothetical protein